METMPPFNLAIIVITGIISYAGFTRPGFAERFLFDTQGILRYKQYYRIISSGFLHGDWIHLIFNMYTLYSFGGVIEQVYGPIQFLAIYFTAIIGGNLLSLVLHRNHEYYALGASGGVCGIIFACIFLLPGSSVYMFFIPFPIPAHYFVLFFIIFSYIGLRGRIGNIGHDAHLGGAIIGLVVTTIMHPSIVIESPKLYTGVMGLSVAIMLLLYFYPLHLPGHTYQPVWNKPKPSKRKNNITDETNRKPTDEEVIERLLDKVSKRGINSLTYVEKSQLEAISRKRKQREQSNSQKDSSQV
jgi:membrane associated rhomboid family serine protease